MKESGLRADYFYSYPEKKLNLTAFPFNWLEATIFYSSIENKPYLAYGGNGYIFENQSYKDKGFNVKAILKQEGDYPAIAIGLNDFAVLAEIWQHTDPENPSNEDDIVRISDDYGR